MLNRITWKKTYILTVFLILSVFLTATAAYSETKLAKAGKVTFIPIDWELNIRLKIPAAALSEDTVISAEMVVTDDRVTFVFGPSPLSFNKRARLQLSWEAIDALGIDNFTLFGPDGAEVQPETKDSGLMWYIPHFSLYYHRRR